MLTAAAKGYFRTRFVTRSGLSRARFERWQARRLAVYLRDHAVRAAAFADLGNHPLSDFPVMDKATLMEDFARYNRFGITADEAWDAMERNVRVHGCAVGASTGTSGNRGLYLVSDAERFEWLGVMLAKALPDAWRRAHRVAIMLPASSSLYDAANESGRLALKFFDLREGVAKHEGALAAFAPTCLVAPPKALLALTTADESIAPERVFSAAEVLDPADRHVIEERFGGLAQIYMATEGLLAVTCSHGTLHLAEDLMHFEFEPIGDLVSPIITDFSRRTQMMVRYRMNDLLRLKDEPCPCGSPLQAVAEIAGRTDDAFVLEGESGPTMVTPDVIRNAVVGADRTITDFRVRQTGPQAVTVVLEPGRGEGAYVQAALAELFAGHGCTAEITVVHEALSAPFDRKLRRVERVWTPGG
ncbi:MAG: F390 synthetase-related protein [Pseudomonadota bacterium]